MKWKELIPDTAWVVDDLLTGGECERFISRAKEAGIESSRASGDVRHRNSTSVSVHDEDMARAVFQRIKTRIPKEIWIHKDCDNNGIEHCHDHLHGKWTPYALNARWRVVCYPGKGHFGPHRDGFHEVDENHRSFITINGYLTDRPIGFGGATRFVRDDLDIYQREDGLFTTPDDAVIHRVEADKAGKAVVFFHDLMHDGEPLSEGSPPKWLFRTEIMYERDPDTAPKLSNDQRRARQYLKEAEAAETEGEVAEAIKLYSRAYRLDPTMESPG